MFIAELDTPDLLTATVNGKPGYVLLPNGEQDSNALYFTGRQALLLWAERVSSMAQHSDLAQPYEERLDAIA